jgi:lipopolysaccharide biosynthesis glycosyltransferase
MARGGRLLRQGLTGVAGPIEIACAARHDYLPHTATMIASALTNAGSPIRVHLLVADDVGPGERNALGRMVEAGGGRLELPTLDPTPLADLKTTGTLPGAHWYRVLLPDLLELERVLYLDSDLLVLDSLLPLWEIALGEALLAAVTNPFPDPDSAARHCAELGVAAETYFNSGVMLLDLTGMHAAGTPAAVIDYGRRHEDRLVLPEQDAMNAVLASQRLPLAPRWNAMVGVHRLPWSSTIFGPEEVAEAIASPAIRHFEGSGANKPWSPQASPADRELYMDFRRQTPWPALGGEPCGSAAS